MLWINPVGTTLFDEDIEDLLSAIKQEGTQVKVVSLPRGPEHLEYHYYEALVLPDLLHVIQEGERRGYDGAVIGCFYDLGLRAAKEITQEMMVTAPAKATMSLATSLGNSFSILVGREKWIPEMKENVLKYGYGEYFVNFKTVGLGVLEFHENEEETRGRLKRLAKEAVEKDGAEVLILGCTIQFGFFRELQKLVGVPVLDSVVAPFKYVEFLAELKHRFNWKHSKIRGYEPPPTEEIRKWGLKEQYKNVEDIF
ncbi:MAG: hydantoin racemase [Candidatus Korarchaeota archaeon]|nr:hydantoin racemase [Candidatus Korarchaeota archaeon]NIU83637.1 hydantoin racemase [Candidatus Thorarchaeota archaeon]NIW13864.1 hydantoin racemase [Candidatus Thorarchaeota archaeon]NIW51975.1 hydantoin racemase [Candidatus Korarchaeota archaeon]